MEINLSLNKNVCRKSRFLSAARDHHFLSILLLLQCGLSILNKMRIYLKGKKFRGLKKNIDQQNLKESSIREIKLF